MTPKNPNLRYRSTGQLVYQDDPSIREERKRNPSPLEMREAAMEEIVRKREAMERSPDQKYKDAIDHFDYRNKDLTSNPTLLGHIVREHNGAMAEAAKTGRAIDWENKLQEIEDKVRASAGYPTRAQADRSEVLENMRSSREAFSAEALHGEKNKT